LLQNSFFHKKGKHNPFKNIFEKSFPNQIKFQLEEVIKFPQKSLRVLKTLGIFMWLSGCRVSIYGQLGTLIWACFWDNAPSFFQENLSAECVCDKNTKILDTLLGGLKSSCNGCQPTLSCTIDHPCFLFWESTFCLQ